eukprot:g3800.t1
MGKSHKITSLVNWSGDGDDELEFLHVKPGKGSAFVRTKLKNCITGSILDKTFRAGEQLTTAEVQKRNCQFTYSDNDEYIFMDMESFEEHRLIKEESWAKFLVEGLEVDLTFYQTRVIGVDPPQTVEMKVVAAEAGVKGNTAQGGTHPVTLESGAVISAPLFVGVGDKIKIDTKRELYLSRV